MLGYQGQSLTPLGNLLVYSGGGLVAGALLGGYVVTTADHRSGHPDPVHGFAPGCTVEDDETLPGMLHGTLFEEWVDFAGSRDANGDFAGWTNPPVAYTCVDDTTYFLRSDGAIFRDTTGLEPPSEVTGAAQDFVAIVANEDADGFWLVTATGQIFTIGRAPDLVQPTLPEGAVVSNLVVASDDTLARMVFTVGDGEEQSVKVSRVDLGFLEREAEDIAYGNDADENHQSFRFGGSRSEAVAMSRAVANKLKEEQAHALGDPMYGETPTIQARLAAFTGTGRHSQSPTSLELGPPAGGRSLLVEF